MSFGNLCVHLGPSLDLVGSTITSFQIPQQISSINNPIQIQQLSYNSHSSVLSKRFNPYELSNTLEQKLRIPEGAVVVEILPLNSFNLYNSIENVVQLGGLLQPVHYRRETEATTQPFITNDFSFFKPQLPQHAVSLKHLETSV